MTDPWAKYDTWKLGHPDDEPEEPTEDELDARDAMIDLDIDERQRERETDG